MVKPFSRNPEPKSREELEALHGRVWSLPQFAVEFVITSIIVPDVVVVRQKRDGEVGTVVYQNFPRYFHTFRPYPHQPS